jgi:hypothetical protein
MRALLRSHAEPAIEEIIEIAKQRIDRKLQLAALEKIVDRAGLQPFKIEPDKAEISGPDGAPFRLDVAFVDADHKPKG